MIRILIADDHVAVRRGLKEILLDEFMGAFIDEAVDTEILLKKVMKEEWNMVITDISMPGRSGIEALEQIRLINPKLPVLVLSVHTEEQYAIRVLKAGALGYLTKESPTDEFIKAVHTILLGKKYITASLADRLVSGLDKDREKALHETLSGREFEILKLIASGKSVSGIAEKMSLSVTTVSTYRMRILTKMGMRTNADLTIYAIGNKLL